MHYYLQLSGSFYGNGTYARNEPLCLILDLVAIAIASYFSFCIFKESKRCSQEAESHSVYSDPAFDLISR